ncbi:GNAT family N-acetyltransferase [Marinilactibacillus piezotolerans]|uniref:GNAT family N-acetyltransferase n=1 Tax=Marinilactibacillus piezotolerans TaxID=258723 RepID=UPI0009B0CA70|nr:GNAT family N-acetyltransferase [Marinilactibacillus piezotolerans]
MTEFKRIDKDTLETMLNEIFEEQDEEHFGKVPEAEKEEIAIGLYIDNQLAGGIVGRKQYQSLHISLLAIKKAFRGKSLGTQLLKEMERTAVEKNIINVTLTTRSYQAAGFYKKCGYTEYGSLKDMPIAGVTKIHFYKRMK